MLENTDQTFDSVQDYVEARSAQRAKAAAQTQTEEVETEEIEAEAEEVSAEEEISEDDPSEEEIDAASDEDSEVDDEPEAEEKTPARPAVEPPQHLKGEEREQFAKLSPDAQAIVTRLAKDGEAVVTRKAQELNQTRQLFQQRMEGLDAYVSEKEAQLQFYERVNWAEEARILPPDEYQQHRANFEQLRQDLQTAKQRQGENQIAEHKVFVTERTAVLNELAQSDDTIAKALIDPEKGIDRQKEVFSYMHKNGLDRDTLLWVPAQGLTMAYKAMMYDRSQERAKTLPGKSEKPQAKPAPKVVRSTPSAVQGSSQSKRLKQLQGKSELTHAEHTELMRLERSQRK